MLVDEMERVERGEEPMAVIRDPAENEPMIDIRRERLGLQGFRSQYKPAFQKVQESVGSSET
jgi:hypothetical protein